MILTGRQFREGRLLAGMTQVDLAKAAGVELALVVRIEAVDGLPMIAKRDAKAIRTALEAVGVELLPEIGGSAGVRLREAVPLHPELLRFVENLAVADARRDHLRETGQLDEQPAGPHDGPGRGGSGTVVSQFVVGRA